MESDPSEHGSPRPMEEEVESHVSARCRDRDTREDSSQGAIGRAQQAFLEQMTQMLRQVIGVIPQAQAQAQAQAQLVQRSPLEKLRKYGAVDFKATKEDDPTVAEYWLERTERVLRQLHCTPEQQLECAISLLQEDAYRWWVMVSRVVQPTVITWDFFLAEFKKKYINHVYLEARRREFLALRQRQLTVLEYEREFVRLSRYAWEVMPTEADRCRRFENGLNDNIRLLVLEHRITDFSQLVVAALNVERVRDSEQTRRNKQRKRGSGSGQSSMSTFASKKPKGSQSCTRGEEAALGYRWRFWHKEERITRCECLHCGRRHKGECQMLTGGCFRCGATDHYLRDCPQRSVPTAPPQTERSARAAQRGRRPARTEAADTSQKAASETVERPEAIVAPCVYAMKAWEESNLDTEEVTQESEAMRR
ncbi:uncharacterized protein LOC110647744 [Hevea brasiliensis]|uniref:uncharacterized protein LOC110647744 n=1 Tax=Hevea brasiliensis TaxID=3981 RepID=UPI0025CCBDD1|nr:uncharacterized protein LOC110647744 [Hevea brasiliensis]XP_058007306.1 uncharacterized protein LOC110647744 [Hevea brasiliensis]